MAPIQFHYIFSLFATCMIVSISAVHHHDVAPPRLAPLLAPVIGVDCASLIYDMADCISYISVGSSTKQPDPKCCSGFKTVIKTNATCVCEALRTTVKLGFTVDMKRAGALGSDCKVKAPSVDKCLANPPSTGPSPLLHQSPAPAPHLRSAPVPHAPVLPTHSALTPTATEQVFTTHAPAPSPESGAYALATSPAGVFIILTASFVYALV